MQILTHETMTVCAVSNTISQSFVQLYKIVSTAARDDVQVFIKKARLCTILT